MNRFWVSWSSRMECADSTPPFPYARTGTNYEGASTICACLDAEDEETLWAFVAAFFPDFTVRFCVEVESFFTAPEWAGEIRPYRIVGVPTRDDASPR